MFVIISSGLNCLGRGSLLTLLFSPVFCSLGVATEAKGKVFLLLLLGSTHSASEDVLVLLLGEVYIIVSVGMAELGRVVSVILPQRI